MVLCKMDKYYEVFKSSGQGSSTSYHVNSQNSVILGFKSLRLKTSEGLLEGLYL